MINQTSGGDGISQMDLSVEVESYKMTIFQGSYLESPVVTCGRRERSQQG